MITLQDYETFPLDEIFARGVIEQGPFSGVHFVDKQDGRLLKWVAKKGCAPDWTMYFHWDDENSYQDVADQGDKLSDRKTIQRILNCDDEVMLLYRK